MYRLLLVCFFVLGPVLGLSAQELRCEVRINSQGKGTENIDKRVFEEMKKSIQDFLNLEKWTGDAFSNEERIACNMMITITNAPKIGSYEASVQVQLARPIYGTGYESLVLNYLDKDWEFEYVEGQPMIFDKNSGTYQNNLTSLLAFYAYVIIGYDYDTFSKLGGKPYLNKAQLIAANAQQSGMKGWKTMESTNNRAWLIDDLLNQQLQPFREGIYDYHRLGLDMFADQQKREQIRTSTIEFLTKIKSIQQQKPFSILLNNFFDTKASELINMFTDATPQQKQNAYNLLSQIDPTKIEKYQKLIK